MPRDYRVEGGMTIIAENPGEGFMLVFGRTVPSDGDVGFGESCVFINQAGTTLDTVIYVNLGDKSSCNFDALLGAS